MIKQLTEEEHLGVWYHLALCTGCDLVQAVEHISTVSPDYVNLDESAIDNDRVWCQGAHKSPAFRQWFSMVREYSAKPGARLLDIGCGTGGFLRFASKCGFDVYGFDASQAQADYAATEFANVLCSTSLSAYIQELKQPNLKFDVVTLWDVFEHIRNPLIFVEKIKDALNPEGVLFLSVPNGRALMWKLPLSRAFRRKLDFCPWEHVFYYSPRSLALCLQKAGLSTIKLGAVPCYPRPLSFFEIWRRIGFAFFHYFPSASPQIFAFAKMNAPQKAKAAAEGAAS